MNWPNDADGDVLRRLKKAGFDFQKESIVDFNIDFNEWPLTAVNEEKIRKLLPGCKFFDPDEEDIEEGNSIGYVLTKERSKISYEFVIEKQKELTKIMKPYGGWCDSWGVMN